MPTTPRTRRPQPRTHHPTAAHLPPHSSAPTRPSQRTFSQTSAHFHAHSPLHLPTFYLKNRPTPTHLRPPNHAQTAAILPTFIKRPMHIRAIFYRRDEAVLRWERRGSHIRTNRCYYAVRVFLRRYPRKVYRVSEKSL